VATIYTHTDDSSWFDGDISLRLEGPSSNYSNLIKLAKGHQTDGPFNAGAVNTFDFRAADLGDLARIQFSVSYTGGAGGACL
jgi:hypothetical protein